MQQISEAEFDATIGQLADLIPVERDSDGCWAHGMMVANVTTSYLDEAEFLEASPQDRITLLRRAYCTCLAQVIEFAAQLLDQMAIEGSTEQFKNLCKLMFASMEAGHKVIADYNGGEDAKENEG
jgi:hypothetical protein